MLQLVLHLILIKLCAFGSTLMSIFEPSILATSVVLLFLLTFYVSCRHLLAKRHWQCVEWRTTPEKQQNTTDNLPHGSGIVKDRATSSRCKWRPSLVCGVCRRAIASSSSPTETMLVIFTSSSQPVVGGNFCSWNTSTALIKSSWQQEIRWNYCKNVWNLTAIPNMVISSKMY